MNPSGIEIDPDGNVTLCPGICIGNANEQSLLRILEDYEPRKHPIISILVKDGPDGLYQICRDKGLCDEIECIDDCHLCFIARRHLVNEYPRELSPESCYDAI